MFFCKGANGLGVAWTLLSLSSAHSPPSAWTGRLSLREACKGCWVIPFSGSGWGLGWAPGWRTSQALPRAQTSQTPPAQPRCRSREPGTNYRGLQAGPSCSGGWRWGSPLDVGPGEGTLWSPETLSLEPGHPVQTLLRVLEARAEVWPRSSCLSLKPLAGAGLGTVRCRNLSLIHI